MLILSIESSCDESSAAVVENGRLVLSNVISSQIGIHKSLGGVVPEIAAREHLVNILPVIDKALKDADKTFQDINYIAVTSQPGLIGCLLVGMDSAQTLAYIFDKKLLKVNHIHGHIFANWLVEQEKGKRKKEKEEQETFEFPIVILSVSGGHNDIILMKSYKEFEVLGSTLDDAAGEAFDKVARMIGLEYPGGPAIQKAAEMGDKFKYKFPRSMLDQNNFNFSFSGLKTSVLYTLRAQNSELRIQNKNTFNIDLKTQADIAASFQESVCDILTTKLLKAAEKYNAKEVHLTGGVSANKRLREMLIEKVSDKYKIRYPKNISFCTDNAAMIGAAAYHVQIPPAPFHLKGEKMQKSPPLSERRI